MLKLSQEKIDEAKTHASLMVRNDAWILGRTWFPTPRLCLEYMFGANLSKVGMSLTAWQILEYWDKRYLSHLTDAELSDRAADCIGLASTLTDANKIGVVPVAGNGLADINPVWVKCGDVFEECRIRYGTHFVSEKKNFIKRCSMPSRISEQRMRLASRMIYILSSAGADAIIRFGKSRHIKPFFQNGDLRMSPASMYQKTFEDKARRDNEMAMKIHARHSAHGAPVARETIRCGNYWMWCATRLPKNVKVSQRLFGDFDADSCVVIRRGNDFLHDFASICNDMIPNAKTLCGDVRYIDPILEGVTSADLPLSKHFRFSYQNEVRMVRVPHLITDSDLDYVPIQIGTLLKYDAEYIGPDDE